VCAHRRASIVFVQWRVGLRPGEALELVGSDLQCRSGGVGNVAVGMRAGTKTRRRPTVRVAADDWRSQTVLRYAVAVTPPTSSLCDWMGVQQVTAALCAATRPAWHRAALGGALPEGGLGHGALRAWHPARGTG
jgi:hypothetical protein